ncbi:hypothetical protein AwDysgo_08860 [Bacteroidales bacterium]|nr:hypothetical protein AwDysgo_08860 [Bacteroidales bacterium]
MEFGESPTIKLRGQSPLVVVDGVPYKNLALKDFAADDIESIDVLKGATASALYGERGAAGAIMITTKKGLGEEGLNIDLNSKTMFFAGYLAFPKVQSAYSHGLGGKFGDNYVWGDKLDIGRTALQYDPYSYEWNERELTSKGKNNYKNFLQTSFVTNNNVSVSQKGKYGSVRGSMTHVHQKGQYPNQGMDKGNFSLGGTMNYKAFSMDAGLTYNKNVISNTNGKGYSSSYIYDMVIWGGTEFDVRDYKDYWVKGKENIQQNWYDNSWYDNPWFKSQEVVDSYDTDLVTGYANLSYEIRPWLKAMVRGGIDAYTTKNKWWNAMSANYAWNKHGFFGINRQSGFSANTDGIMLANKSFGKFSVDGLMGLSMYYTSDDFVRGTTSKGLNTPGFYSLNASVDPAKVSSGLTRMQTNSIYGKATLAWDNTYYLDVTGRNDWTSTLSADERSYFYPSLAGSIIVSEIISLPKFIDFSKIRAF